MDKIEYDPRIKSAIKDALHHFLYAPVENEFDIRMDKLITRNTALGGYSHKHFVYRGVLYTREATPAPLKKNRLVPALRNDMEEFLRDQAQLNEIELPYVVGFINQVLNSSNSLADYLRVLPESMHRPLQTLIDSCPCRSNLLSEDRVLHLQCKNANTISLMKQRLASNLLI